MTEISSSMIIANGMGLKPDGIPASKSGHCTYCGLSIKKGDFYTPTKIGPAFMDDLTLTARGSDMTCGYCIHFLSATGLRNSGFGVFNLSSTQPFRKWKDVAAGILEPPEPPFVMVYATANNQHMAWRAPINYSRDLFYVRVGLRDLKIRRPLFLDTIELCKDIGKRLGRKDSAKTLAHPFDSLSPHLKSDKSTGNINHGSLNRKVNEIASADEIQKLWKLTLGEIWALRFILSPGAGEN